MQEKSGEDPSARASPALPLSSSSYYLAERARAAGANLPNGVEEEASLIYSNLCASAEDRDTGRCPHLDSIRATPDSSLVLVQVRGAPLSSSYSG